MKNYYQILGLDPNCSQEEVKKAYRLYAMKFHPDKQSGDPFFGERFKEINEAYIVLINENLRIAYDRQYNQTHTFKTSIPNTHHYEQELAKRENEIRQKETELKKEKQEKFRQERLKKEFELRNQIFYKDNDLEINGLQVLYSYYCFNIYELHNASYKKVKQENDKIKKLLSVAYGLIVIGVATIVFYVGVFLILLGLIFIAIAILNGSFKILKKIATINEYMIILKGIHGERVFTINGSRRKAKKIVSSINQSVINYFSK